MRKRTNPVQFECNSNERIHTTLPSKSEYAKEPLTEPPFLSKYTLLCNANYHDR